MTSVRRASSILLAAAIALSCGPAPAFAKVQAKIIGAAGGATWIPVADDGGPPACIDGTKDMVSITLRRIILEKQSSWWGLIQDKQLTIPIVLSVSGASGGAPGTAKFAKTASEAVTQYPGGKLSLPDEEDVLTAYSLNAPNPVTNSRDRIYRLNMEVRIVRTKGASEAATILSDSVSSLSTLNLPALPFSDTFKVATGYVTGVFQDILKQTTGDTVAIANKDFKINLSSNGCKGGDASTGTVALLLAAGDQSKTGQGNGPVYVDVTQTGTKCFYNDYNTSNTYELLVADRPGATSCDSVPRSSFKPLENSYLLFMVDAEQPVSLRNPGGHIAGSFKSTTAMQQVIAKRFESRGASAQVATAFAHAVTSAVPNATIAADFQIPARAVMLYRQTVRRCTAYHVSASRCASRL